MGMKLESTDVMRCKELRYLNNPNIPKVQAVYFDGTMASGQFICAWTKGKYDVRSAVIQAVDGREQFELYRAGTVVHADDAYRIIRSGRVLYRYEDQFNSYYTLWKSEFELNFVRLRTRQDAP